MMSEWIVLKIFGGRDALDLAFADPSDLDEEGKERAEVLRAVVGAATSAKPPRCVLCGAAASFPALIGILQRDPGGRIASAFTVCEVCAESSSDIRAPVFAALGREGTRPSSWAS
jgi:hypothetical protein